MPSGGGGGLGPRPPPLGTPLGRTAPVGNGAATPADTTPKKTSGFDAFGGGQRTPLGGPKQSKPKHKHLPLGVWKPWGGGFRTLSQRGGRVGPSSYFLNCFLYKKNTKTSKNAPQAQKSGEGDAFVPSPKFFGTPSPIIWGGGVPDPPPPTSIPTRASHPSLRPMASDALTSTTQPSCPQQMKPSKCLT